MCVLQVPHSVVETLFFNKLMVLATICYETFVEYKNVVILLHRFQTMSYCNKSFTACNGIECFSNPVY